MQYMWSNLKVAGGFNIVFDLSSLNLYLCSFSQPCDTSHVTESVGLPLEHEGLEPVFKPEV